MNNLNILITDYEKKLSYNINKDGFRVHSDMKKSEIILEPSIKKGLNKSEFDKEITTSLADYKFVNEFKL